MRTLLRLSIAAITCAALAQLPAPIYAANPPVTTPPAPAKPADTSVPVKVVVLFSSGVGYFEHVGPVNGNATTELRFKTNQINDILKSLVLQDTGGGKVGNIVYPSQDPIGKILRSFQIDITSNPPLAELLNQLRGAKVKLTLRTGESNDGTILGAEKKPKAVDKGQIDVWVLNLVSGGTITSIALDDVTKLQLEDAQLQEELTKALAALAQSRDQDKKPVTIQFQGQGERTVRVGYVVETPIWKTSYRLFLSPKPDGKNNLQGWAIVENQTDNDWTDVQLSLVSGRPISFIEELYQPLYIPRPVVQPELYASLRPQTYEGGMVELEKLAEALPAPALQSLQRQAAGRAGGGGNGGAAMSARRAGQFGGNLSELDAAASIASVASAGKIGELFQYSVGSVSLPRQRSAMLPIVTEPIEVERLSIYNASVLAKNPLNGARVKNTTKNHLLQGPITVLEGSSYAGDARIDNLPPGQERLISYGIDLQMQVNATRNRQEDTIVTGRIVKGVLNLQNKHVFTQEYIAENKDEKAKTLIIEHAFRPNWQLIDSPKPSETTEALYRFKQIVPAGKTASLTVKEQSVQWTQVSILNMLTMATEYYTTTGSIPKPVRDAIAKAVALKGQMVDTLSKLTLLQSQRQQIVVDQQRIREDIKAVEKGPYQTRMITKLEEQEKQLEDIDKNVDATQKTLEKQRKDLEDYISGLNIG
jgi:hypothetical protein